MRKKILLIRSVSLQQMDKNLPQIYKKFSDYDLYILTHPHNVQNCRKYKGIKKILTYKRKGNFSAFFLGNELKKEKFESVLYFVSNIKGFGFLNVSFFALRVTKKNIFRCNLNSDIEKVSKTKILLSILKPLITIPLSFILTVLISPLSIIILFIHRLKSLKNQT